MKYVDILYLEVNEHKFNFDEVQVKINKTEMFGIGEILDFTHYLFSSASC